MNRQDLRTAVANALVRQDLAATQIDFWIQAATTRMNTALRHRQMIRHKVLDVTGKTFRTPSDFIEARNVRINTGSVGGSITPGATKGELLYAPPAEIASMAADCVAYNSSPKYFTLHGSDMELAPWVSAGPLQIEMWYYSKISLPADDSGTNFMLTDYPQVYLNGTLIYGHRFELEEERALGYEAIFMSEIQSINDAEKMAEVGNGPLIVRPTRRIGGRFS